MTHVIQGFILFFCHLLNAFPADIFFTEFYQIPGGTAEDTCRLIFLQDDAVVFHVDLQFISLSNIKHTAQLNRQYDSAQVIYLPNNSG